MRGHVSLGVPGASPSPSTTAGRSEGRHGCRYLGPRRHPSDPIGSSVSPSPRSSSCTSNNAQTRLAWANAQAAAAAYGSTWGEWLPTLVTAQRIDGGQRGTGERRAVGVDLLAPRFPICSLISEVGRTVAARQRLSTTPWSFRMWCCRSRWTTSSISRAGLLCREERPARENTGSSPPGSAAPHPE